MNAALTASDADRVDAWVEARAAGRPQPNPPLLLRLLSGLDPLEAEALELPSDATLAGWVEALPPLVPVDVTLTPGEAAEVDRWVDHRDAGQPPERWLAPLGLLDQDRVDEPADDMVQRTAAAVEAAVQRDRFSQQVEALDRPSRGRWGFSMRQAFGAAAVCVLGTSLYLPMAEQNAQMADRLTCLDQLRNVNAGLGSYAADHDGLLPRRPASAGLTSGLEGLVGMTDIAWPPRPRSAGFMANSSHLFELDREGRVPASSLACRAQKRRGVVEHPAGAAGSFPDVAEVAGLLKRGQVPYSYQNQFTADRLRVDQARPDLAVVADKNPMFSWTAVGVRYHADVAPGTPSPVHGLSGQNVAHLDGSAGWRYRPISGGDHIWKIDNAMSSGRGVVVPAAMDPHREAFLMP